MTLTRDQILAKRLELPREILDVPELGGKVTIRILMLKEVREIQKIQKSTGEPLSIYSRVVAMACINEDGSTMFVGEDIKFIDDLPFGAINKIVESALKFSKMVDNEEENGNGVPKD